MLIEHVLFSLPFGKIEDVGLNRNQSFIFIFILILQNKRKLFHFISLPFSYFSTVRSNRVGLVAIIYRYVVVLAHVLELSWGT